MSKSANKRANHATFLAEALLSKAEERRKERLKVYEPPPYKHGFIVKPTNPGWVKALDRKMRMYADRIARCEPFHGDPWLGWEVDGEIFDRITAKCKQRMIQIILDKGEVSVEEFWKEAQKIGISRMSYDRYVVNIVQRYCTHAGKGLVSAGGFLPTDENYDTNFV